MKPRFVLSGRYWQSSWGRSGFITLPLYDGATMRVIGAMLLCVIGNKAWELKPDVFA